MTMALPMASASLSFAGSVPAASLSFAGSVPSVRKVDAKMFGANYTPEETEAILENQAAAFTVGAKGVPLPWTSDEIQDAEGLKKLAIKLNPVVGYWDPFEVGEVSKELVGWFRHAEIKHGRVAMAGFVGFCIQLNGIHWPWNLQGPLPNAPDVPTISFGDISAAGGPLDQWDAVPSAAKLQILFFVGLLELWSETSLILEADGQKHYVRGGKPGYFPKLRTGVDKGLIPHPVPYNFFDPLGITDRLTPEQKETKLLAEINNGRLAMIGMMGLVSASKGLIVPGLDSLGLPQYAGEPMAFFSATNADLPLVKGMLDGYTMFGQGS